MLPLAIAFFFFFLVVGDIIIGSIAGSLNTLVLVSPNDEKVNAGYRIDFFVLRVCPCVLSRPQQGSKLSAECLTHDTNSEAQTVIYRFRNKHTSETDVAARIRTLDLIIS